MQMPGWTGLVQTEVYLSLDSAPPRPPEPTLLLCFLCAGAPHQLPPVLHGSGDDRAGGMVLWGVVSPIWDLLHLEGHGNHVRMPVGSAAWHAVACEVAWAVT